MQKNDKILSKSIKFLKIIEIIFEIPQEDAVKWIITNLRDKNYITKKKYEHKTDDYYSIYKKVFEVRLKDVEIIKMYINQKIQEINMRTNGLRGLNNIDYTDKRALKGNIAMLCSFIDQFKRLNEAITLLYTL